MDHLLHSNSGFLAPAAGNQPLFQTKTRTQGRGGTTNTIILMRKSLFTTVLIALLAWHASTAVAETLSDRITVTVRGTGPDVVLIPGLASSSAVWEATAAHLE